MDIIIDTKNNANFDSKNSNRSGKSFNIVLSDTNKAENTLEVSNISVREIPSLSDINDPNFYEQYIPDNRNEEAIRLTETLKFTITN